MVGRRSSVDRIEAVAPHTWMIYLPLVNVVVFKTDEGLVLVNAGMAAADTVMRELIANVTEAPIHRTIYLHPLSRRPRERHMGAGEGRSARCGSGGSTRVF